MAIEVPTALERFQGKIAGEIGAAMSISLAVLGDRLGLYKALAAGGPCTSVELALKAGVNERNVREWLAAQATSGYVDYDDATKRFWLNDEQRAVFANEDGPAYMAGGFELVSAMFLDETKVAEAFRSGRGLGWHERCDCLFRGTERFFRPGRIANLMDVWIPALEGVEARLRAGARVADVGCGRGAAIIMMARAFPNSRFVGFDYHAPSVEQARAAAEAAGVADRVTFQEAAAKDFGQEGAFDLITLFDALHDMGDPVGAARHVRSRLVADGTCMLVEPKAADELAENLTNPFSRMVYSASAMICTPVSMSQEVGLALGAAAGPGRLMDVAREAGFSRVRRVAEDSPSLVIELRP
ncbi:MAG: class I SAM-dependent methyltransferase [Caulobacteraceae bacterium]